MNVDLKQQAAELGLTFDFDRVIPTNSLDAHRLLHLAKKQNLQDEVQERLFSAYFIEGKNISARDTLTTDVRADETEAHALGLTGVPAFVIDQKYLISGAQSIEVFLQALQESWKANHQ